MTWFLWVTIKIVLLERRLVKYLPIFQQVRGNKLEESSRYGKILPYEARYQFLEKKPLLINDPKRKIKIPADFFNWQKFTIIFWVQINEDFCGSLSNRYIFAHTSGPKPDSGYPNAFFLGIIGDSLNWRFVINGPNPKNSTKIHLPTNEALIGWKMFAIRWRLSNRTINFTIDVGNVFSTKRTFEPNSFPKYQTDNFFHLGGWLDDWHGGMSMLQYYNFRIYKTYLSDDELNNIFKHEKSILIK